jgi:hypothetical protein
MKPVVPEPMELRDVHAFSFCSGVCVHGETIDHHDMLFCEPFCNETHHDVKVVIHNGSDLRAGRTASHDAGEFVCCL